MFGAVMLCKMALGFDGIVGLVIYLAVGGISYLGMIFLLNTVNIREMKTVLKYKTEFGYIRFVIFI